MSATTEFYVTFGQRYRHEQHPELEAAHPDGWLVVEALDLDDARAMAFAALGSAWAFVYALEDFDPTLYPLGELARLTADEILS